MAPIILWKPTDKLLFEGRFDIFLAERSTEVDLAYAEVSYLLSDYLTVAGGKFVLPFGIFWERARAPWINKLPTMPLLYSRGLVGEAGLGFQLRGGAAIGSSKINYAAYAINGPEYVTNASDLGRLGYGRGRDNNNNRTIGGRIGFLPIPELEIGSSILAGRVGQSGSGHSKPDTLIVGVDLSYGRELEAIRGRLDLRGEAVWVDTEDVSYGGLFDLFGFDNKSHGWYLQAAYRPTKVDVNLFENVELKNVEFVFRYDSLRRPGARQLGVDRDQLTFGLDYWIRPNVVLKAAYVFDDAHGGDDQDAFLLQMGVGF